jgi:hypothetical protein
MPTTLQLRRYSACTINSITGAEGELIVDTTADTITVHDGVTAGGTRLAKSSDLTGYATETYVDVGSETSNNSYQQSNSTTFYGGIETTWDGTTFKMYLAPNADNQFLADLQAAGAGSDLYILDYTIGTFKITLASNWNTTPSSCTQIIATTTESSPSTLQNITNVRVPVIGKSKARSAYDQANTATNNAASASLYANNGITLAQAAYDQANTGGGGGSTGDWTFSGNNVSLPLNDAAVITTNGTVLVGGLVTYSAGDIQSGGSDPYFSGMENRISWSGTPFSNAEFASLVQNLQAGDAISWVINGTTYSSTVTNVSVSGSPYIQVQNNGWGMILSGTVTSITLDGTVSSNASFDFTFEPDGTFVSDSLFVGELFVANNIITPMNIISGVYNTESTQPVVINGDLEVLGSISSSSGDLGNQYNNSFGAGGASREDALSSGKQFEANKKYRLTNSGSFVLPDVSTLSPGDVVEVLYLYNTGMPSIYCYEDTTTMLGWTNLSSVSVNDDTYDYATISSIGAIAKFVYYTTINPIGGATQHKWMVTQ